LLLPLRGGSWRRSAAMAAAALLLPAALGFMGVPDRCKPAWHLPDFALGIALAGIFEELVRRRPGLVGRGRRFYLPALVLGGFLVGLPRITRGWTDAGMLLRPINAIILIGLGLGGGRPARWLSTRSGVLLGRASYAMYILHIPLLWWFKRSPLYRCLSCWPAVAAGVYIIGVVAVSTLVFRFFEEPANRYLRRRFGPQPAAA